MSRLSNLMGKPMEVSIGGEDLTIKPLTVKDLPLLMSLTDQDSDKRTKAMVDLIVKTLRESVPDATEEEITSIGVSYFKELSEAIMKVNGMENVEGKSKSP